jgi:hypothetical protein
MPGNVQSVGCSKDKFKIQIRPLGVETGQRRPQQATPARYALAPIGQKAQPAAISRTCRKEAALNNRGACSGPRRTIKPAGSRPGGFFSGF